MVDVNVFLNKHVEESGERALGVALPLCLNISLKMVFFNAELEARGRGRGPPAFVHRTPLHVISKSLLLPHFTHDFQ